MSGDIKVFDQEILLPDAQLGAVAKGLLGFEARYARIQAHLRLLLAGPELEAWNRKFLQG